MRHSFFMFCCDFVTLEEMSLVKGSQIISRISSMPYHRSIYLLMGGVGVIQDPWVFNSNTKFKNREHIDELEKRYRIV